MYYDLDKVALEKYEDGQLLYYTPSNSIWEDKPSIIIVERSGGYHAKQPGLPTETRIDPHYVNGQITDYEVFPISEDSHPEIFVKMGFRI